MPSKKSNLENKKAALEARLPQIVEEKAEAKACLADLTISAAGKERMPASIKSKRDTIARLEAEEREAVARVFGLTKDQIAWGHKTPIQHIYGHGPG